MPQRAADASLVVLVVDDDDDTRALLRTALEHAGYGVRCARDGHEALRAVETRTPDAVLLDVVMHGLDGFKTCARLRAWNEELPIVFMTGLGDTEHVVRGFEAGANDYVTKPLSLPEVIARLAAHTRTARLARAAREALDANAQPMVASDGERILWMNQAARALLHGLDAPDMGRHLAAALIPLSEEPAAGERMQFALAGRALSATRVAEPNGTLVVAALAPDGREMPGADALPRLTARESQVLLWVARGKTNRDIADILGMSPRTVNKHLEHIFEKLGVETRTAAAAAARRLRLDGAP